MKKIAVLYQSNLPPKVNGIQKPLKPGGYADSGADIAYELLNNGLQVATPVPYPINSNDKDWVFPDTAAGISRAVEMGANILWLNTVLYKTHPITNFMGGTVQFVGQLPATVERFDDKLVTNAYLQAHDIPVPKHTQVDENFSIHKLSNSSYPLVLKPLRGRGSQGVKLIASPLELQQQLEHYFSTKVYGDSLYIEPFLSGQEITITVMPAGVYRMGAKDKPIEKPWCLPAVKRFNHANGIALYNGVVAVTENSAVLTDAELSSKRLQKAYADCIKAAVLLNIKAAIRIDCRADAKGDYYLIDINLKPNMTGPSRDHRKNQDSLSLIAARKLDWSYYDFLMQLLNQRW